MTVTLAPGVAVVIPFRGRAHGLPATVDTVVGTLDEAGLDHTVILVDDASPDSTREVAEWLLGRYPGRVELVRHETARGPDAARASGIEAALARTDHDRVLLADPETGRSASALPRWLADAAGPGTGTVLGRRPHFGGRGFELLDRRALSEDRSASPARPQVAAPLIGTAPDRLATAWVGARFGAFLRSYRRDPGTGVSRRDPVLALVTAATSVVSVVAFLHFLAARAVLAYPDAAAHLLIARRVVDSPTPGAAQLGAVWLPLPHVLALPLVGVDAFYVTGFAAAVVSMAAYVLTARYLYKIVVELTGRRWPGVVAAAVFALCPNVLYLQSTPMSELPFLWGVAGATYHLVRWCRTGRHMHLAQVAALTLLATTTRYESWVFALAVAAVVVVTAWNRTGGETWSARLRHAEAHLVYFGVIAFAAVVAWFGWNLIIFGDVTYFYDGAYAKVPLLDVDVADGSWPTTLLTFWYAIVDNIGAPLAMVGGVGLVVLLASTRLRGASLAAAAPLVLLPFFLWFVYAGSRPLRVMEISGSRYNVRFGLIMIIPVAILVGYLVAKLAGVLRDRRGWATAAVATGLVGLAAFGAGRGGTATLQEADSFRALGQGQANARAAAWLSTAYTGGRILMDTPGNETVVVDARLPTREIVYDGSYQVWEPTKAAPAAHGVEWIYMRGNSGGQGSVGGAADNPDRVWTALADTPELDGYRLVYAADDRRIYHWNGP